MYFLSCLLSRNSLRQSLFTSFILWYYSTPSCSITFYACCLALLSFLCIFIFFLILASMIFLGTLALIAISLFFSLQNSSLVMGRLLQLCFFSSQVNQVGRSSWSQKLNLPQLPSMISSLCLVLSIFLAMASVSAKLSISQSSMVFLGTISILVSAFSQSSFCCNFRSFFATLFFLISRADRGFLITQASSSSISPGTLSFGSMSLSSTFILTSSPSSGRQISSPNSARGFLKVMSLLIPIKFWSMALFFLSLVWISSSSTILVALYLLSSTSTLILFASFFFLLVSNSSLCLASFFSLLCSYISSMLSPSIFGFTISLVGLGALSFPSSETSMYSALSTSDSWSRISPRSLSSSSCLWLSPSFCPNSKSLSYLSLIFLSVFLCSLQAVTNSLFNSSSESSSSCSFLGALYFFSFLCNSLFINPLSLLLHFNRLLTSFTPSCLRSPSISFKSIGSCFTFPRYFSLSSALMVITLQLAKMAKGLSASRKAFRQMFLDM